MRIERGRPVPRKMLERRDRARRFASRVRAQHRAGRRGCGSSPKARVPMTVLAGSSARSMTGAKSTSAPARARSRGEHGPGRSASSTSPHAPSAIIEGSGCEAAAQARDAAALLIDGDEGLRAVRRSQSPRSARAFLPASSRCGRRARRRRERAAASSASVAASGFGAGKAGADDAGGEPREFRFGVQRRWMISAMKLLPRWLITT